MQTFRISKKEYICEDYGQNFVWSLSGEEKDNITRLKVKIDFGGKLQPKKVTLKFYDKAISVDGFWSPNDGLYRRLTPDYGPRSVHSRSVSGYPLFSLISFDDANRLTVYAKDAETPLALGAGYREENSLLEIKTEFFLEITDETEEYETELVFDRRPLPFYECVRQAAKELAEKYGNPKIPQDAFAPAFSTWYCFHQQLNRARLIEECKAAKELELQTVIIDDGWQTEDNNRGYAYAGDYRPAAGKVGDIHSLTNEIRAVGLKSMLWFSIAFSGDCTKGAETLKDMSLYYVEDLHAYVVDPRFCAVRGYIVSYLSEAVRNWGFDGLKLDFIDCFHLTEESAVREGTDCASLEEGIRRLIDELRETLSAIREDVLIELRQSYFGPVMQRLGNMFRVGDCPGALVMNRIGMIDLRLVVPNAAVHADMLEWNEEESPEYVAKCFINTIFSVLQFSVFPTKLSDGQKSVSRRYIRFMKKYEDVLLHGELYPQGVLNNYLSCRAKKNGMEIISLYADVAIRFSEGETIVLNGGNRGEMLAESENGEIYAYRTEDCYGNKLAEGEFSGLAKIVLPVGGILFAQRK